MDGRPEQKHAGKGKALGHAAGKDARARVREGGESHVGEHGEDVLLAGLLCAGALPEGEILHRGQVAVDEGRVSQIAHGGVLVLEDDLPGGGPREARDHAQKGRLAGTVAAGHKMHAPGLEGGRDIPEQHARGEAFANLSQFDHVVNRAVPEPCVPISRPGLCPRCRLSSCSARPEPT